MPKFVVLWMDEDSFNVGRRCSTGSWDDLGSARRTGLHTTPWPSLSRKSEVVL